MNHLKSIVFPEICQFPLCEGADGQEMRMDIHWESFLCDICMLGHAHNSQLLVGDPS